MRFLVSFFSIFIDISAQAAGLNEYKLQEAIAEVFNSSVEITDIDYHSFDNFLNRLIGPDEERVKITFKTLLKGINFKVSCESFIRYDSRDIMMLPCHFRADRPVHITRKVLKDYPLGLWFDFEDIGL